MEQSTIWGPSFSNPQLAQAYGKEFQQQLLRHLCHSQDFLESVVGVIVPTDFTIPFGGLVWEALVDAYTNGGNKIPDYAGLELSLLKVRENVDGKFVSEFLPDMIDVFVDLVTLIFSDTAPLNVVRYQNELTPYLRSVRVRAKWQANQQTLMLGGDVSALTQELVKIETETAGINNASKFVTMDQSQALMFTQAQVKPRITTGLQELDALLYGGLEPQELGLIVAPPGRGKTNMLLHLGAVAANTGCPALFITLEMSGKAIFSRYIAMTAAIPAAFTKQAVTTWPEKYVKRWQYLSSGNRVAKSHFEVLDLSETQTTVFAIEAGIKTWLQNTVRRKLGVDPALTPCLICVDWISLDQIAPLPDSVKATNDIKLQGIMGYLKKVCRRLGIGMWSAAQGNKGSANKSVVTMVDTAGAWLLGQNVDIFIGFGIPDAAESAQDDEEDGDDRSKHAGIAITKKGAAHVVLAIDKHRGGDKTTVRAYRSPTLLMYNSVNAYFAMDAALTMQLDGMKLGALNYG